MASRASIAAPAQTGWFVRGVKPARAGVYGTNANNGKHPCFQHWDGQVWGKFSGSVEGAALRAGIASSRQDVEWYGLAEVPGAEPSFDKAHGALAPVPGA